MNEPKWHQSERSIERIAREMVQDIADGLQKSLREEELMVKDDLERNGPSCDAIARESENKIFEEKLE
jgi:hypothetical protein